MNILVTGANGQLGREMRILSKKTADMYFFTDVSQVEGLNTFFLDITDFESVRAFVFQNQIQAIVNCAAYTNVDAAETNPEVATLLNAQAPEYLAKAIHEVNGLLIHISTDYVFGKEPYNTPCREDQKGTPTGVYGQTKLQGEQNILATGCQYVILRTAWLYSEFGKNFCKTMMDLTATKSQIKVVFDQVGTPTYAYDLAQAIFVVLADYEFKIQEGTQQVYDHIGVYHYSNEGVCSWFDFAKMIALYNDTTSCDILPCYSKDFPSPVTRPSYSVLDKTKFKETFAVQIPYWVDSLKKCILNLKNI